MDYNRDMDETRTSNKLMRMPSDLLADLTAWAAEEDRSVHAQILHVLRQAVRAWRRQQRDEAANAA